MTKRRFVLITAVCEYADKSMPRLPGVQHDAGRLRWTLKNHADAGVHRFVCLTNGEATKENILTTLREIARQANDTDQIVVYFGGHGACPQDTLDRICYRLLPYDASFHNALTHGIAPEEIQDALQPVSAAEIILIFDCCHSGGVAGGSFWDEGYLEDLRSGRSSLYIMAAARGVEEAGEMDAGGFFLCALCDALQGKGVTPNEEGQISVAAAWARAAPVATQEAARWGHEQHPVHAGIGSSIYLTHRDRPWLPSCFYHPYPATKAFTGRAKERAMLTEWFTNPEAPPVLVLDAIGGMGKTALAWKWVNDDLLRAGLEPDGLFWWSFYESDATFENFIKCALAYFGGKGYEPDLSLGRTWWYLANLFRERRCLLVLDGVERRLRAYERPYSVYQGDEVKPDPEGKFRECVSPDMRDFLVHVLSHTKAKVLLTTRLRPRELDNRERCQHHRLEPMTKEDAVAYFRARGITEDKASRSEIEFACDCYGYHPLALTLLIGAVLKDPEFMGDIRSAKHVDPKLVPTEPSRSHVILELAYNALAPESRQLLSQLAAFRFAFDYQMVKDIFGGRISNLRGTMAEFDERGFLMRGSERKRFDMHPVVRQYAYDRLTDKEGAHTRLRDYFYAVPQPSTAQSLEDLAPVVELYHHAFRAGRYDEAYGLYQLRLSYQLSDLDAYQTIIELLSLLFTEGDELITSTLPGTLNDDDEKAFRSFLLNELARVYAFSGQPRRALTLFEKAIVLSENATLEKRAWAHVYLPIVLTNLAQMVQIPLGELAAAEQNLRRAAKLESSDREKARSLAELGRLLAYKGAFSEATRELDAALALAIKAGAARTYPRYSYARHEFFAWAARSLCALLMGQIRDALESARRAQELADEVARSHQPFERDFIQAEWLLGAVLVTLASEERNLKKEGMHEAESLLIEALIRCRRINHVALEPQILLVLARLRRLQEKREEALELAQEALGIANRCEYRLQQADIHNFLTRFFLDEARPAVGNVRRAALALAREHAKKGKGRAWCEGPPHCYRPALNEVERLLAQIRAAER